MIDNELALNELNNVSLPLLDERLKSAEQNFLDAQKRIDDAMADIREVEDLLSEWQWEDTVEIDGGKIRANTIQALSIVAGSITTTQIRAGSIVGNDLAINTITAREINAQTITANELASDSIMTRHIRTNAVTANEIAARTIVADNIAAGTITGTQIAADTIRGSHIFAGTITATEISSGAITAVKIASNAVTTVKLDAEAVTAAKISANTITAAQIAANTITANEIRAQTIVGDSIASNAIIARHITANSIVAGKIASGAVTTAKLAAGAVTATTIAARAVSADKLATNAIQVGFNSMGNSLRLTPTSLAFWQSTTVRFMEMTGTRLEFFTGQSTAIGGFERSSISGRTCVAYFARNTYSLVLGRIVNSAGTSEQRIPVMEIQGNNAAIQMHANINMNRWSITNQSDIRLKENIQETSISGIKETKRIRMVDFDWKQDYRPIDKDTPPPTTRQFGMIAQEVPFLQANIDGDNHYLSIDMNKQVNLNTKTNQELIAIVESQEQRIQKLEREMEKIA